MFARRRSGRARRSALLLLGPVLLATLGSGVRAAARPALVSVSTVADSDTYTSSASPTRSFGDSSVLRTAARPLVRSYLSFTLPTTAGVVVRATLRIHAEEASRVGYRVSAVRESTWPRSPLTYARAPQVQRVLGGSGAHPAGWTSVDVTVDVRGPGRYGFMLSDAGGGNVGYSSREGMFAPHLDVLTRAASPPGSSTRPATPVPVAASTLAPTGPAELRHRKDLIYGSEIGAWRSDGGPAVDPATGIPRLVRAARIRLVRFAQYDAFSDMADPTGHAGTESRARFDAAIDGIRTSLGAEPFIKLLPISRDVIGTKPGSIYCPRKDNLGSNLPYDLAIVRQAGPRVRLYESSNEMEYTCSSLWGFRSAGAVGVSRLLGQHYAATMPAVKKYARALGFPVAAVGYVGVSGGTGWGNTVASPNTRSMTEFMTAAHDAYVASGNDPDYIPDAVSIHAYPYSPDFSFGTPLTSILAYYDSWVRHNRQVIDRIWGPVTGSRIKLVMSEWNAGNSSWPGFGDDRVGEFYREWLQLLRRDDFWLADQFAIASNGSSRHDMIGENGTTRRQYDAFVSASTLDPLSTQAPPD